MSTRFNRTIFDENHEALRHHFRQFLEREIVPRKDEWDSAGIIPHEVFEMVGALGFLCPAISEEFGGVGVDDFRFNTVLNEEALSLGLVSFATGLSLCSDVALPYFSDYTTPEQKLRWLPGLASGKLVTAIGMTEPSGGSDLAALRTTARLDGDHYVLNGAKTFITNGINADLVLVAARTDPGSRHGGISLLVVERGMPGFERGRNLDKVGMHAQDTAELFFDGVKVPRENLIGEEGQGFRLMMLNLPQERLAIALSAIAIARHALDVTLDYVSERKAFGRAIGAFQNSRMAIAEMRTEIEIGQIFIDRCIRLHVDKQLTAEQAAMAKWWATELQGRVIDRCVQLHGGYGYMMEYPIARAFVDSRISRIYGGTTEIMKDIIAKAEGFTDR